MVTLELVFLLFFGCVSRCDIMVDYEAKRKRCLPALGSDVFDGFDVFLPGHHFSENSMLAVEMGGGNRGDEELGTVAA